MPHTITHPFSGAVGQSCSYTANFIASHADEAKALGMTEAQYENHPVQGHWGVAKGKIASGDMPDGSVVLKGSKAKKNDKSNWTMTYDSSDLAKPYRIHSQMYDKDTPLGRNVHNVSEMDANYWANGASGQWVPKIPASPPPAVSPISNAVGSLTDQDAATLFVKVKDDFAKAKGINVKGANAALDMEVYESIGQQIGYSATELSLKVERYKADGHKLSALKKKVLKDESMVTKAWAKKVDALPDPPAVPTVTSVNPSSSTNFAEPPKATVKATTDPPPAATLEATQETAAKALADLQAKQDAQAFVYADEDVAKAYIKAKDELASSTENPWTLYTQKNKAFEDAIVNLMEKSYGIELEAKVIRKQIASYLGEGNKLSVLKKKMAKTGEHKPLANTLKKTKAQKLAGTPSTTSHSVMTGQVDDFAHYGYQPNAARPSIPEIPSSGAQTLYDELKNTVAAYKNPAENFEAFLKGVKKLEDAGYDGYSALDAIRSYDIFKAKALGVENSFFYEKKMAEWASSQEGKAYILSKKTTEEIIANLPPLPRSSAGYPTETTINEARRIQRDMGAWSSAEQSALRTYTGGSYHAMNGALRRSESLSGTIRSAQKGMRASTEKMFAHRGTSWSQFGMNNIDEAYKLIGKTVTDKGFLSTSVGPSAAFGGQVKLEIEITEGTFAAFVKDISKFTHENELLLAHGTHFQVLSVTPASYSYGPTTIRVRTIPGSHGK